MKQVVKALVHLDDVQIAQEYEHSIKHLTEMLDDHFNGVLNARLTFAFKRSFNAIKAFMEDIALKYPESEAVEHFANHDNIKDFMAQILLGIYRNEDYILLQALTAEVRCGALSTWQKTKYIGEFVGIMGNCNLIDTIVGSDCYCSLGVKPDLNTRKEFQKALYLPPNLVPPMMVESNEDAGRHTLKESVLLGRGHHDRPQNLDILNVMNQVAFSLDLETCKEVEQPPKDDFDAQQLAVFEEFRDVSKDICRNIYRHGNKFYFLHKYDKRGRVYTSGYHVNLQSTEYKKAQISLFKKEYIHAAKGSNDQFSPLEWLMIDIANQYGMDKRPFNERIAFVVNNRASLGSTQFINEADKPLLYKKALRALEDAEKGNPTGFMLALDATCSGGQIMAALMGCTATAKITNLINSGKVEDLYTQIIDVMNQYLDPKDHILVKKDPSNPSARTRDDIKKAVIPVFYGSKKAPSRVFGDNKNQLEAFWEALDVLIPGVMECLQLILNCWDSDALYHEWTLPDGHVAHVKVYVPHERMITSSTLDFKYVQRAYINDASGYGMSLPANVVHSIDGYVVREMVRRAYEQDFDIATIHDSFWCHPRHVEKMRHNYKVILSEIAQDNLLEGILSEITGTKVDVGKQSTDLPLAILNSEYALS